MKIIKDYLKGTIQIMRVVITWPILFFCLPLVVTKKYPELEERIDKFIFGENK